MLQVKTHIGLSAIEGIGLFANQCIPKDATIWHCDEGYDVVMTSSDVQRLPEAAAKQILKYAYRKPGSDTYVLCIDDTRFFNHSSDPNVGSTSVDGPDTALRDIQEGEELTIDYYSFDADAAAKLSQS